MSRQPHLCDREKKTLGPPSPGTVGDDEFVCRAAFAPYHLDKHGLVKQAVIRTGDLIKGELSVWRLTGFDAGQISDLLPKLSPPANNRLDRLLAVRAREVRDLRRESGERSFSLIDDSVVDQRGSRDPQHAAIAPCKGWRLDPDNPNPIHVDHMRNKLHLLLKDRAVWTAPPI